MTILLLNPVWLWTLKNVKASPSEEYWLPFWPLREYLLRSTLWIKLTDQYSIWQGGGHSGVLRRILQTAAVWPGGNGTVKSGRNERGVSEWNKRETKNVSKIKKKHGQKCQTTERIQYGSGGEVGGRGGRDWVECCRQEERREGNVCSQRNTERGGSLEFDKLNK